MGYFAMKALRVTTTFAPYSPALANCRVTELKLEKAIPPHSELRQSANRQIVRDLRTLREAAIILDAKKHGRVSASRCSSSRFAGPPGPRD